ncbi:alpha/beta hydrolase-fold protein [Neolewinella lacunae]|uniref:Alpha/beta hydrolase n=1 Tax=Neolewinella lacunae TaxID=1517758 RepID=A0A923PLW7_9BACT|nr:alpha/beta hydrolase-fold protein [Neolewinella lacunae]MBC6993694.1 alpha/beta hydrolase [Neolewinella lacunae]MDN3636389.1 alpha/beta hydrolase-fold protein [Neolewinella lacunae]
MKYFTPLIVLALTLWGCAQNALDTNNLNLSSGRVERIENFASEFAAPRNIDVWLPDGYSATEEYAVLYMHDGQMLFDSTASWNKQEWGVDETMNQLLEEGTIRNSIVVGIWNTESRHSEYFPQQPFESLPEEVQDSLLTQGKRNQESGRFKTAVSSDNYLKFIVTELKPFIDQKYSTLPDRKNTFIAGSSMGGLISMYALCEYPDVFQGAACLSTHWIGTFDTLNNPIPAAFVAYLDANLPSPQSHSIYFDFGTETLDALYEPYQVSVDSIMVKHGFSSENWKTLKFEGEDHSEKAWKKRLHIPLQFLLGKE